jgi:RNA ligase (TIGR02306 family)
MDRELATVRKISDLMPIEGAERIELARVDGWNVVVKKGEFAVGDLCVYVEIDSVLPADNENFNFLEGKPIKTQKIRGAISQGICFPLTILPYWEKDCGCPYEWEVGEDVTMIVGATLSDEESEDGEFPWFIPKTKEERIQNITDLSRFDGIDMIVTEKLDGMSATFYLRSEKFGICSRNCEIEKEEDFYSEIAQRFDIEAVMRKTDLKSFAIQGEIVGPKVSKNPLKLKDLDFFIFHVFDIDNQQYLDWTSTKILAEEMGMKVVPSIHDHFVIDGDTTVETILEMADGKSLINKDKRREGIVVRSRDLQKRQFGKVSFKAISNRYLLKKK